MKKLVFVVAVLCLFYAVYLVVVYPIGKHIGMEARVQFDSNRSGSISVFVQPYNPTGAYPRSGYISVGDDPAVFPMNEIKKLKSKHNNRGVFGYFILDYKVTDSSDMHHSRGKVLKAVPFIPDGKKTYLELM